MGSKLFKNSALYSAGTILPQLVGFILLPVYTRFLSPSDYGILSAVQVVNSVLILIFTLAIDKAIYRIYFDFKTDVDRKTYLGTIFIGLITIITFFTAIIFAFPNILGSIYKGIDFYPYMSLSVMTSVLATFAIVPRSSFFVKEEANKYISISLLEFFFRNAFILLFLVGYSKGIIGYLQGQLVGSAVLVPYFLYLTFKNTRLRFNIKYFIPSLKFSLPILPMLLSSWVMSASDRVFLERFYDAKEVGLYSLGYKIAMLVSVFAGAFYKAYNPFYYRTATQETRENAYSILHKTNTVYLMVILTFTSLVALFSKEIVIIFFDNRYIQAYQVIGVVSLAYAIGAGAGIFNLAIYQEKKTVFLMYANIFAAAINIVLNFLLIKHYGAIGAAWATVISYVALSIVSYFYAKKCFYVSFSKELVFTLAFLLLLINVIFSQISIPNIFISIGIKLFIVLFFIAFILLKFKKDLKLILK